MLALEEAPFPSPVGKLWVDNRWSGNHGIARYAGEVLSRLTLPYHELPLEGNPVELRSVVAGGWRAPNPSDVVYSPGFVAGATRTLQVITLHDLIHLERRNSRIKNWSYRMYFERVLKPVINRAGVVLTVSATSRRRIEAWIDNPKVRVVDAGNGRSELFTREGAVFQSSAPYLLMVGNAKQHKNARLALQALAKMRDFRGIIVSQDRDAYRTWVDEFRLTDRVTLLSHLSDEKLAEIYRGAAALLFPSRTEGFGLPALEAGACGTPTVYLPECESVREIVDDPRFCAGAHDDVTSFLQAIDAAIDAKPDYELPSLDRYTWNAVAGRVQEELRRLVSPITDE